MREIKFRIYDKYDKNMYEVTSINFENNCIRYFNSVAGEHQSFNEMNETLEQFTNLLDKNGLTELYEGDIIDIFGKLKGNIHENIAGKTDLVIQGFGSKTWIATYSEAVDRGCKNTE